MSCIDLTLASGDPARRGDSDVMNRYNWEQPFPDSELIWQKTVGGSE